MPAFIPLTSTVDDASHVASGISPPVVCEWVYVDVLPKVMREISLLIMTPEFTKLPSTITGEIIRPLPSKVPTTVTVLPDSIVSGGVTKSSFNVTSTPELIVKEPPVVMVTSSIVTSAVTVTLWPIEIVALLKSGTHPQSQVLMSFQGPSC